MGELERLQPFTVVEYGNSPPALVFGSNARRRARAETVIGAAGVRLSGSLGLDEAPARLRGQAAVGLAWLELGEEDDTPALYELLGMINAYAETGGTRVIAAAPFELVDVVSARLSHPSTEILVNASPEERAASLALAMAGPMGSPNVSDVGKDNSARLRQLSDEMGRIASTLARLSTGPGTPALKPRADKADPPAVDAETVRSVIRARRLRSRFFSEELFADPAWDMLLDLLQAEIGQLRVPVSSLCIAAAVPATTALRWIKTMTEQGLFVRRADPHDGRRVFVELAPAASEAMRRYFADAGKAAVI